MNGKGSNRRKGDDAVKFRENYDRIFNKWVTCKKCGCKVSKENEHRCQ